MCNTGYLPTFGGGHDFYICSGCNTSTSSYSNFNHTYEAGKFTANKASVLAGSYNFKVEDIEVYEVKK